MITKLLLYNNLEIFGAVAQLVRASDCRSEVGVVSAFPVRA